MKIRGDVEAVNLATGERWTRVSGDGESRLVSNMSEECSLHQRLGPVHRPPTAEEIKCGADEFVKLIREKENHMETNRVGGPIITCKLRVTEVVHVKDENGETTQERVKLIAVYGKDGTENAQWSKYTPSANFDIYINNPQAFNKLSSGHEFLVDFTPAAPPSAS